MRFQERSKEVMRMVRKPEVEDDPWLEDPEESAVVGDRNKPSRKELPPEER